MNNPSVTIRLSEAIEDFGVSLSEAFERFADLCSSLQSNIVVRSPKEQAIADVLFEGDPDKIVMVDNEL